MDVTFQYDSSDVTRAEISSWMEYSTAMVFGILRLWINKLLV